MRLPAVAGGAITARENAYLSRIGEQGQTAGTWSCSGNRCGSDLTARCFMRFFQSVFQRRFMRRLSVGTKLWISTAILAAPLLGLGAFYVQSLTSTLWFTDAEEHGLLLLQPLDQFERRISRHAEMEGLALASGSSAGAATSDLLTEADESFKRFEALEKLAGNAATHAQFKDLVGRWESLKTGHPGSIAESLNSHEDLLDAAVALRVQIAADWQLRLDPELAAYNLIDVSLMKMPDVVRYVGETRARLADVYARKEFTADDGFRIATLTALVGDRLVSTRDELTSAGQAAVGRPGLVQPRRRHSQGLGHARGCVAGPGVEGIARRLIPPRKR